MNFQKTLSTILTPMLFGILLLVACNSDDNIGLNDIEVAGTIQVQGITTYQYGTHEITGYALRSSTIDLNTFVNQSVTVVGNKIVGYPVDGGPDYLEVVEVK